MVAPPRGERGLKHHGGIQIRKKYIVAPPRGERGLKQLPSARAESITGSLPLVGSVD